ncbi:hypothetical protein POSPLADRAFT_1162250 [Postia placenta MAD-698-R-SB12]|uniref:Uncharacterized protein n=1 Tax=Postia placenta MAD-698-R-SB12 TaxID=670580 RepID=A0A1X6MHK9_9APHY|nr:hypothetical protein POSPLADRAFT_1162250 [Postia placenta MAD-698-R-SB12]OSX55911.1 hypothetical protein POSPLADRAFT_1162250 [Postia placenta MAD-698-R-SB12]
MRSCDRNLSHSMMVLPAYRRGRRSFRVSLSGGDTGEDLTGDEGDGGLPAGEDSCCDCPPGELREEQVLAWPRGGDGGEGDGGSPGAGRSKNAVECHWARSWEAFLTAAPGRAGGSLEGSLEAVRLPQFLEGDGDLLALDLYWRQVGGCGHLERQVKMGQDVPKGWAAGVLDSSDWHVMPFVGSDGPRSMIRARLSITDEEGSSIPVAFGVVAGDVDLLLGVEGMLNSRAVEEFVSHGDGGEEGEVRQEPKPRVREDKYHPLKAGGVQLDLTEAMGRLCALVRAQLVRAQHADAAPGAGESERLCQRSPSCAVHCRPI